MVKAMPVVIKQKSGHVQETKRRTTARMSTQMSALERTVEGMERKMDVALQGLSQLLAIHTDFAGRGGAERSKISNRDCSRTTLNIEDIGGDLQIENVNPVTPVAEVDKDNQEARKVRHSIGVIYFHVCFIPRTRLGNLRKNFENQYESSYHCSGIV